MAIAHGSTTTNSATASTLTLASHVHSGTNPGMICMVARKGNSAIVLGITWNGTENFERVISDKNGDAGSELWQIKNPTVKTADVVITLSGSSRCTGAVSTYTGVDLLSPLRRQSAVSANGTNAAPTVDVIALNGEIVVDSMCQVSAGPNTVSAQSGTSRSTLTAVGGGTDTRGESQEKASTGATETMSYTMSGSENWSNVAAALQEPQDHGVTGALNFNGISDYVEVDDHADLNVGTGDFCIGIWQRGTGAQTADARMIVKGSAFRYDIGNLSFPSISFVLDDDVEKDQVNYTVTESQDGEWHLWLFERDAGSTLKIFLDGDNEKISGTNFATGSLDSTNPLFIGKTGDEANKLWEGDLAGFFLIKRLLTGFEKDALAQAGPPNLLADVKPTIFMPLWGIHNPEIDLSGNNHTGTVFGTAPAMGPPISRFTRTAKAGPFEVIDDAGGQDHFGIAPVFADAILAVTASLDFAGKAAIAADAILAVTASLDLAGVAAISADAVLAVTAGLDKPGAAAIFADAILAVTAGLDKPGAAPVFADAILAVTASIDLAGVAAIDADAVLAVSAEMDYAGKVALFCDAVLAVAGTVDLAGGEDDFGVAAVFADAILAVTAGLDKPGAAPVFADAILAVTASLDLAGVAPVFADAILAVTASLDLAGVAAISADAVLAVTAGLDKPGAAAIFADAILAVTAGLDKPGAAAIAADAILAVTAGLDKPGAAVIFADAILAVTAEMDYAGQAPIAASAVLGVVGTVTSPGDFDVFAQVEIFAGATLEVAGSLDVAYVPQRQAHGKVSGIGIT